MQRNSQTQYGSRRKNDPSDLKRQIIVLTPSQIVFMIVSLTVFMTVRDSQKEQRPIW